MALQQFGPGFCWVSGLGMTGNRTLLGNLKSCMVNLDPTIKTMRGSNQVAMYAGTTEFKISGSAEFENLATEILMASGLSQLASGGVAGLSVVPTIDDVSQTISTNTITITGMTDCLMVRTPTALGALSAGSPMTKVVSGPTTGQYSVSGSAITFAAADVTAWAGAKPAVTWLKAASTDTKKIALVNAQMQQTPYLAIESLAVFDGKYRWHQWPRCIATKLPALDGKDDFAKNKLEFEVLADPNTGVIGTISLTEGT